MCVLPLLEIGGISHSVVYVLDYLCAHDSDLTFGWVDQPTGWIGSKIILVVVQCYGVPSLWGRSFDRVGIVSIKFKSADNGHADPSPWARSSHRMGIVYGSLCQRRYYRVFQGFNYLSGNGKIGYLEYQRFRREINHRWCQAVCGILTRSYLGDLEEGVLLEVLGIVETHTIATSSQHHHTATASTSSQLTRVMLLRQVYIIIYMSVY